jgi:predicted Rdx family selenoprotein
MNKMKAARDLLDVARSLAAAPEEKATAFQRDGDGFVTVSFRVKGDALHSFLKLLKQCEYMGSVGHTFKIVIDPEGGKDRKREVGFDGDGADRVKDILVNGDLLPEKFEW